MGGFTITYVGVPDQVLDQPITVKTKSALGFWLQYALQVNNLTYVVTSEHSITIRPSGLTGTTGATRPGVSTGVGAGTGRGTGAGVAGGTSTGVGGGVQGGVSGGVEGGVVGGVLGGLGQAPARNVAPWRESWPQDAARVGGTIKPPTKTVDVKPVYPAIAQSARVQGVVICEVLIGPDGKVDDAHILRSIPLLDQAALDAVRQWEFTATLLNGNPVPVIMTVTVNFVLDGGSSVLGLQARDAAVQQAAAIAQQYAADREAAAAGAVPVKYGQATDWPAEAVRIGGNIKPPTKILDVKPVYPEVAQKARVQGVVICEVLVRPDGTVADVRVLRSIPLLDQAAFNAVLQWIFTPTLLNGSAVPVVMTVTVNFTLE